MVDKTSGTQIILSVIGSGLHSTREYLGNTKRLGRYHHLSLLTPEYVKLSPDERFAYVTNHLIKKEVCYG